MRFNWNDTVTCWLKLLIFLPVSCSATPIPTFPLDVRDDVNHEETGCSRSRAERFRAAQFRAAQFRAARFSAAAALKRAARNWEEVLSNTGDRQAMVAAFTFEIGSLSNVLRISVGDKHVTVVERYSFFV